MASIIEGAWEGKADTKKLHGRRPRPLLYFYKALYSNTSSQTSFSHSATSPRPHRT